jgi:hypothetical protein
MLKSSEVSTQLAHETVIERGHRALTKALGVEGAFTFIREITNVKRSVCEDDGVSRTLIAVSSDQKDVVINFTQSVTWVRLTVEEVNSLVEALQQHAGRLQENSK